MQQQAAHQISYSRLTTVPGWLTRTDYNLIRAVLTLQTRLRVTGDILEIGAYEGRSAIAIATTLAHGERLHICDPFEGVRQGANPSGDPTDYQRLARSTFEANFSRWHAFQPEIYQCLSSQLTECLAEREGAFRLVHIDGSHTYEDVQNDLELARSLLCSGGVVVADDYRQLHTPGVAAATWQAVAAGLQPILLSPGKFYGVWDSADPLLGLLAAAVAAEHCTVHAVTLAGSQVLYATSLPSGHARILRALVPTGILRYLPKHLGEKIATQ